MPRCAGTIPKLRRSDSNAAMIPTVPMICIAVPKATNPLVAVGRTASGIKVVLSSITPVSGYHVARPGAAPQTSLRPIARIKAINDWMRNYAGAHKHVYLDYYSKLVDSSGVLKEDFSADDLHPTAAGYAVMAPLAEAAIAQALR